MNWSWLTCKALKSLWFLKWGWFYSLYYYCKTSTFLIAFSTSTPLATRCLFLVYNLRIWTFVGASSLFLFNNVHLLLTSSKHRAWNWLLDSSNKFLTTLYLAFKSTKLSIVWGHLWAITMVCLKKSVTCLKLLCWS